MPVIDVHTHIYPDKIAQRAVESVRDFYGFENIEPTEGTVSNLLSLCEGSPITRQIVCSVAVKPSTVASINSFIAAECAEHPQLVGFMAMHQDLEDPEAEINRAVELGLKGIKIHPDTQRVNADDPRLMNMYEIAQAKKLPVMLHAGDYRYDFSHPHRIAKILQAFPELVVNAAHFGGWSVFDVAADLLQHERCFVDTCSTLSMTGKRHAKELIDIYGASRVMFGTDFPMWDPFAELEQLGQLGLTDDEYAAITWGNAEQYLGMKL